MFLSLTFSTYSNFPSRGSFTQYATTLNIDHPQTRSERVILAKQREIQEEAISPKEEWTFPRFVLKCNSRTKTLGKAWRNIRPTWNRSCWLCEEFFSGGYEFLLQTQWHRSWVACDKAKVLMIWFTLILSDQTTYTSEDPSKDTSPFRLNGPVVTSSSLQML